MQTKTWNFTKCKTQILTILILLLPLHIIKSQVIFSALGQDVNKKTKEYITKIQFDGHHVYSISHKKLNKLVTTNYSKYNYTIKRYSINKEQKRLDFKGEIGSFKSYLAIFINIFFQKNHIFISPYTRYDQNIISFENSGKIIDEIIIDKMNILYGMTFIGRTKSDQLIITDYKQKKVNLVNSNLKIDTSYTYKGNDFVHNLRYQEDSLYTFTTILDTSEVTAKFIKINTKTKEVTEIISNKVKRKKGTETNGFRKYGSHYVLIEKDSIDTHYRVFSINENDLEEIKSITIPQKKYRRLQDITKDLFIFSETIHDSSGYEIIGSNILLIKSKNDLDNLEESKNLFRLQHEGVRNQYVIKDKEEIYLLTEYSKKSRGLELTQLEYQH